MNKDLKESKYSESAKTVILRPTYKKEDRDKIKSYRRISILNGFSKICERFLHSSLTKCKGNFFFAFYSSI